MNTAIALIWIASLQHIAVVPTARPLCPQPTDTSLVALYGAEDKLCFTAPAKDVREVLEFQYENNQAIDHPERD